MISTVVVTKKKSINQHLVTAVVVTLVLLYYSKTTVAARQTTCSVFFYNMMAQWAISFCRVPQTVVGSSAGAEARQCQSWFLPAVRATLKPLDWQSLPSGSILRLPSERGGLYLTVRTWLRILPLHWVKHHEIHARVNIDLLQKSFFAHPWSQKQRNLFPTFCHPHRLVYNAAHM